jgi:hypothetical protein
MDNVSQAKPADPIATAQRAKSGCDAAREAAAD